MKSSICYVLLDDIGLLSQVQQWLDGLADVKALTSASQISMAANRADLMVFDWSVYLELSRHLALKTLPCLWVVISTSPSVEDEFQVLSSGGQDYLRSPFDPAVSRLRLSIQLTRKQEYDELESLTMTDALTGLYNRRKFEGELLKCWKQGIRTEQACSLLMIDVDFFKRYNDRYGHVQGDECLRALGAVFADAAVRPRDTAARIGGEEFALLLPDTPAPGARYVAERLVNLVRAMELPHDRAPSGRVTISVGLASVFPVQEGDTISWQEAADHALYQAKRKGRDQVCTNLMVESLPTNAVG